AAECGRKDRAHQAQAAELLDRLQGEGAGLVPFHDVGRDLALGELAYALAQLLLLVAKLEVHRPSRKKCLWRPKKLLYHGSWDGRSARKSRDGGRRQDRAPCTQKAARRPPQIADKVPRATSGAEAPVVVQPLTARLKPR